MKKTILFAGAISLLCASCSNDLLIEENRVADEIRFSVRTEGQTRADAVYCPSNLPEEFNVYAFDEGKHLVMDGDLIKLEGGAYINKTATRYWPESGKLIFKAILNGSLTENSVNFRVDGNVRNQKDLIYAVAEGEKASTPVSLNFRHALSQIVFGAQVVNPTLKVSVSRIQVANVSGSGVYTLPLDPTTATIAEENNHLGSNYQSSARGKWNSFGNSNSFSVIPDAPVAVATDGTITSISAANSGNALMLIPNENLIAWDRTATAALSTGTYFLMTATVKQKVNDSETEMTIWEGDIAIPADFSGWKEGMRYAYTFIFGGNGNNGGYDPEDPEAPVFVPITFNCAVDEFTQANTEIEGGSGAIVE